MSQYYTVMYTLDYTVNYKTVYNEKEKNFHPIIESTFQTVADGIYFMFIIFTNLTINTIIKVYHV